MKKLLIIILCVPLIGFSQSEIKTEYYDDNGFLCTETNNIKICKRFFDPSGELKYEVKYKDDIIFLDREYYENGQIKIEFSNIKWNNGKKSGVWRTYYENGQLQRESILRDGEWISKRCWYQNGNKKQCDY